MYVAALKIRGMNNPEKSFEGKTDATITTTNHHGILGFCEWMDVGLGRIDDDAASPSHIIYEDNIYYIIYDVVTTEDTTTTTPVFLRSSHMLHVVHRGSFIWGEAATTTTDPAIGLFGTTVVSCCYGAETTG